MNLDNGSTLGDLGSVLLFLLKLYPLWLPLATGVLFWVLWMRYIRYLFFFNTEYVLLEIQMPRDIFKSPLAMETALRFFYNTGGESNFYNRYWEGKVRPWHSLEIVSIGGEVRFLLWTRGSGRNSLEAQLYAQYPEIQIREVGDYTLAIQYEPGINDMWSSQYTLVKPSHIPLQTYVDYGLDKNPEEEFKIDPITSLIEALGSIKQQEQIWLQVIIRAHKSEKRGLFTTKSDWKKAAQDERKKLAEDVKKYDERGNFSDTSKKVIASIERLISKPAFDTGIRIVYIAPKDVFSLGVAGSLKGLFNAYSNSEFYNGLKPYEPTEIDYPWQDFGGKSLTRKKKKALDAFKRRMYFYDPYPFTPIILNVEELATIYHPVGQVAATPGLPRIPSKTGQPPANLPI